MSSNSGDCFVILPPYTEESAVIYGRNSYRPEGEASEVLYIRPDKDVRKQKCTFVEIDEESSTFGVIISKAACVWGGESGANDQNVSIGITWTENEPTESSLLSTDLVRLALERCPDANVAVDFIGLMAEKYCTKDVSTKYGFLICDGTDAWLLNVVGQLWAAEKISDGFRQIPDGLSVGSKIDKSSSSLQQMAQDLALWDGSGDFNFAKVFSSNETTTIKWPDTEPSSDGSFGITNLFEILRTVNCDRKPQTSHVSTLSANGISCHWFTATPNPSESVFKPFIFTENCRISPLTLKPIDGNSEQTLLQKLHGQRNWITIGSLLKSLESTCVEEVKRALTQSKLPNQEFDELLKDCVEAEVKFYR